MLVNEIVGRDEELHAISSFLEASSARGSLLIEGGAGIGKTTLWRWGVEQAGDRGWHVLTAGPSASEAQLGFAAIGDLLGGAVGGVASRLPPPQRRALEVALLLMDVEGPPPDQRAVAVGVLGALRTLAGERPCLVAIDDVQWLDRPSAAVLSFVARRLGDDPVALLLAQRTDGASGVPLGLDRAMGDRLARVRPGPLTIGATHRLLRTHLELVLPRPALHRVHAACGGNPFFALEIGRVLSERPDAIRIAESIPVPPDVEQLLARRIKRLSGPGREAVLAAALDGEAHRAVIERVVSTAGLEEAVAAGIFAADRDGLRFTHPLFAEAAVSLTPERRRREMHLRLAAVVADPEAQGLHLAMGTSVPVADVAAKLDRAADIARGRGAVASAAMLAEHAARLTLLEDVDATVRRSTAAANWWTDAGDTKRGLGLVEPLLATLPAGALRLEALSAKARAVEDRRLYRRILEDAVAEAEGYPNQQALLLLQLSFALVHAHEFEAARERARRAVDIVEGLSEPDLDVEPLSWVGRLDVGIGGLDVLYRARDRERDIANLDTYESSETWLGWWMLANDELDAARRLLIRQREKAVEDGDDWSRMWLCWPLTEVECRAGNYEGARSHAEERAELAEQSDNLYALSISQYCRALVAAHVGDSATARACAEDGLAKATAIHSELFAARARIALGFLAVSEERYADVAHHLVGIPETALNGPYWATYPFWGDIFEALVSLGELDRARLLLADLGARRLTLQRPGTAPILARCQGLVLAASGSVEEGLASMGEAIRLQEAHPVPFEQARTLLARGAILRRARRKREARETLHQALTTFEFLGTPLWAERARREIARIGGRRAHEAHELTPSERRIAELVAEGKTNKEVAAILVVSDRTVESALTQIYRKLGLRSRTELARKLATRN